MTTANSTYEIILVEPERAEVLVRGGAFFPVFTPARLAGSSLGGSFLKLRSVHVGFRLELGTDRGFIITSPVRTVTIASPIADSDRHHVDLASPRPRPRTISAASTSSVVAACGWTARR